MNAQESVNGFFGPAGRHLVAWLIAIIHAMALSPVMLLAASPPAGDSDGEGAAAAFGAPAGVAVDGFGNVVVADYGNHTVRRIDPAGNVVTLAGIAGGAGVVEGDAAQAQFSFPRGVGFDAAGNIYVADIGNDRIRRLDVAGSVTTVLGANGEISYLVDVDVAADGTIVFVDDTAVFTIAPGGAVTLLAGQLAQEGTADGAGANARFRGPRGVARDSGGNVWVADTNSGTIRLITPAGVVTTIAGAAGRFGSADGIGAGARFLEPVDVAGDGAGGAVVADSGTHTIRRIAANGEVTTIAGRPDEAGDVDGPAALARFNRPSGVAVDAAGNVFVADLGNNVIRRIDVAGVVTTLAGPVVPRIASGPADITVNAGATATLDVTTAGDPAPTVQWQQSVDAGGTWTTVSDGGDVSGANSATLVITNVGAAWNGVLFRSIASSILGSDVGPAAVLRVGNAPPAIRITPRAAAVSERAEAVFVARVFGAPEPTLQWQSSADAGVSWTNVIDGVGVRGSATDRLAVEGVAWEQRGLRYRIVATNTAGTTSSSGAQLELHPVRPSYVISTVAGLLPGSVDGGAGVAQFSRPTAVAVDAAGVAYVIDANTAVIRRIETNGAVTTIAGSFVAPRALALDGTGNIYVADQHAIRRVDAAGNVVTIVGHVTEAGAADGIGTNARFDTLTGIAVDATSGSLVVADSRNATIRRIDATGVVTTLAGRAGQHSYYDGTGDAARFDTPVGVAVDASGNVWVTDRGNFAIRMVDVAGNVTTLAGGPDSFGGADGQGPAAEFLGPAGIVVGATGPAFVVDGHAVRRVDSAGNVALVAGSISQFGFGNGTGSAARLHAPHGLALRSDGTLLVADSRNDSVRAVTSAGQTTKFAGIAIVPSDVDAAGAAARFGSVSGVAVDSVDRIYVADGNNDAVRRIDVDGNVTTLATNLRHPQAIDVDAAGNVYVTSVDLALRRIDPAGNVTILDTAVLPWSLAVDAAGNAYVVDLLGTNILRVSGTTRTIFTPGIGALGLAVDASGNVYAADGASLLAIAADGTVTTLAGGRPESGPGQDGNLATATFGAITDVAVDDQGNIFVTEPDAHRVRRIDPQGNIVTIAGRALVPGTRNGPGADARFDRPVSVAVDGRGFVVVADLNNNVVRRGIPDVAVAPIVPASPEDRTTALGNAVELTVSPLGWGPFTYQWQRDGVEIVGATAGTLQMPVVQAFQAGDYVCVITDAAGNMVRSAAATVSVGAAPVGSPRLVNLSTRGFVGNGAQVMIPGMAVAGAGTKRYLIRGIGPTLGTDFGVADALVDPRVELYAGSTLLFSNDDWGDAPNIAGIAAALTATGAFAVSSDKEAMLLVDLPAGVYTAIVAGVDGATGVAIVEVYEVP